MELPAQVIETLTDWIDDNLHKPLRIDDIARHAGYSKWHLQRLFHHHKGGASGVIFARKSCGWRRRICVPPTTACWIFP